MIIKDWNEEDRPREKLFHKGRLALSNAELLAILIGSGNKRDSALDIAKIILLKTEHHLGILARMSIQNLMEFRGIGKSKATVIAAALELGRRHRTVKPLQKDVLNSSRAVFELMQPLIGALDHEEFWVILLNNANGVVYKWRMSIGGITATLVDVRLLYKKALEHHATSMILCHNHPSGNLKPSKSDILLTEKVMQGGSILDIKVLDHVIISDQGYYSFSDEGKL